MRGIREVYCMTGEIDIVLMDVVTADGASGLDAAEKIKKKYPNIKIVIVTSMPECSYISRAKAPFGIRKRAKKASFP